MREFKSIAVIVLLLSSLSLLAAPRSNVVPQTVNEALWKSYSVEEQRLLQNDKRVVKGVIFDAKEAPSGRNPIYIATAGGPGARKSTILENYLAQDSDLKNAVYIDPDQRTLRFMVHTYLALSMNALEISKHGAETGKRAYERWRGASNAIANELLNEAFISGYDIAHGTTLTGAHSGHFLKSVKDGGYSITLILAGASDAMRKEAIAHRNDRYFYQTTPEDVDTKGKAFPHRFSDYFANADVIHLHWSAERTSSLQAAATLDMTKKTLKVQDRTSYAAFVAHHDASIKGDPSIPNWQALLTRYGIVVNDKKLFEKPQLQGGKE